MEVIATIKQRSKNIPIDSMHSNFFRAKDIKCLFYLKDTITFTPTSLSAHESRILLVIGS